MVIFFFNPSLNNLLFGLQSKGIEKKNYLAVNQVEKLKRDII